MTPGPEYWPGLSSFAYDWVMSAAKRDAELRRVQGLVAKGQFQDAVNALAAVTQAFPTSLPAYYELAGLLDRKFNRPDLALRYLEQALHNIPAESARLCNSLGVLKLRLGDVEAAKAHFARSISASASFAEPYANLGQIHHDRNEIDAAVELYTKAAKLAPDHLGLLQNYILVLSKAGRGERALEVGKKALKLDPRNATTWHHIGLVHRKRGQLGEALVALRKAVALPGHTAADHSDALLISLYEPALSMKQLTDEHRSWNACHKGGATFSFDGRFDAFKAGTAGRKVKLGYVSGDFGIHPVGHFLSQVAALHDRERFEVYAYSSRRNEDSMTQYFEKHCDHFKRVAVLNDERLAKLIYDDGIDILFDLSGHTADNRLGVFAQKPAPIQVAWLGYPFTTGLAAMDYLISDRFETPEGSDEFFSEKLLRMPNGYLCYQPPSYAPDVNALPALSSEVFTFGCFNNLAKMTPEVVALWSDVLKETAPSRILLRTRELDDERTQREVRAAFVRHGVGADQVVLLGSALPRELMATYGQLDLALDPFPYSGGLTTCESLWMGVPVVTLPGERFCGRHSLTHLMNAGFPAFVATSKDDYVRICKEWRSDVAKLAALREQTRQEMSRSPLVDGARFARDLEVVLVELIAQARAMAISSS